MIPPDPVSAHKHA